eukprot:gene29156-32378_t
MMMQDMNIIESHFMMPDFDDFVSILTPVESSMEYPRACLHPTGDFSTYASSESSGLPDSHSCMLPTHLPPAGHLRPALGFDIRCEDDCIPLVLADPAWDSPLQCVPSTPKKKQPSRSSKGATIKARAPSPISSPPPEALRSAAPRPVISFAGYREENADLSGDETKLGVVSHSSVEKHRRDRLNMLIEELADQVPPSDTKYKADGPATVRRPKHVILSDTLNLLALLKDKLRSFDHQFDDQSASPTHFGCASEGFSPAFSPLTNPSNAAIGMIPDELDISSMGVTVEMGHNLIWCIKICLPHCKNLSAIVADTLFYQPVHIVSTDRLSSASGLVTHVIHVKVQDFLLTPEDLEFCLKGALASAHGSSSDLIGLAHPFDNREPKRARTFL